MFEPEKGVIVILLPLHGANADIFHELDRYHLYVSYGCRKSLLAGFCTVSEYETAWATRTLIVREAERFRGHHWCVIWNTVQWS